MTGARRMAPVGSVRRLEAKTPSGRQPTGPTPSATVAGVARYVIDAPTLLHLVAGDEVIDPEHRLVAPNLIRSQALTLLLAAVADGELTERAALVRHDRLTGVRMRLLGDRMSRRTAWTIAREQGWTTTYEAEYLAVTRLQADALVTVDPELARRAQGLVPLAPLEVLLPG